MKTLIELPTVTLKPEVYYERELDKIQCEISGRDPEEVKFKYDYHWWNDSNDIEIIKQSIDASAIKHIHPTPDSEMTTLYFIDKDFYCDIIIPYDYQTALRKLGKYIEVDSPFK